MDVHLVRAEVEAAGADVATLVDTGLGLDAITVVDAIAVVGVLVDRAAGLQTDAMAADEVAGAETELVAGLDTGAMAIDDAFAKEVAGAEVELVASLDADAVGVDVARTQMDTAVGLDPDTTVVDIPTRLGADDTTTANVAGGEVEMAAGIETAAMMVGVVAGLVAEAFTAAEGSRADDITVDVTKGLADMLAGLEAVGVEKVAGLRTG